MEHTSLSLKFTGYGAEKITFYYAISSSGTNAPTFSNKKSSLPADENYSYDWWYPGVPKWLGTSGTYLWKLTETEFTDNSVTQQAVCLELREAAALIVSTYPSSYPTMGDWCEAAKTTIISGSEIFANSITSKHLTTDVLKSENYNSGMASTLIPQNIYPLAGSYFDFKNGNFYSPSFVVRSNDFQAYFKGNVTAESGTIGGFAIGEYILAQTLRPDLLEEGTNDADNPPDGRNEILETGTNTIVGMCAESGHGPYAFWAGGGTFGAKPFRVGHGGEFWATDAHISGNSTFGGTLTAEVGGQIGGFEIGANKISSGGLTLQAQAGTNSSPMIELKGDTTTTIDNNGIYTSSFTAGSLTIEETGLDFHNGTTKIEMAHISRADSTIPLTLNIRTSNEGGMVPYTNYFVKITATNPVPYDIPVTILYDIVLGKTDQSTSLIIKEGTTEGEETLLNDLAGKYSTFTNIRFKATGGQTYNYPIVSSPHIGFKGDVTPYTSGDYQLGHQDFKWKVIWCNSGTIQTSDKNEKNTIIKLSNSYSQMFDFLKPVSYKFNNGESDRTHIGFIAQDVEQALLDVGLTTQDFAGICYWNKEDGTLEYGLRYEEFIALNTHEIQKLKKRVTEQDQRIFELEEKLSNLEKIIKPNEN